MVIHQAARLVAGGAEVYMTHIGLAAGQRHRRRGAPQRARDLCAAPTEQLGDRGRAGRKRTWGRGAGGGGGGVRAG